MAVTRGDLVLALILVEKYFEIIDLIIISFVHKTNDRRQIRKVDSHSKAIGDYLKHPMWTQKRKTANIGAKFEFAIPNIVRDDN